MAQNSNNPRAIIRNKALLVIGKAEREGVAVRPLIEAKRIAEAHPGSGMTVEEISEEIFRLAVERRLAVDLSG